MDETRLKPFHPYNIILVAQYGKEARWNISICESFDLRILGVFFLKGNLQLFEVAS
jgi:hypothetical protein